MTLADGSTKADVTQAKIVKVARKLCNKHGFHNLTLRDIAADAGIKAGSIYYHFDSKDAIIRAVLEDGIARAIKSVHSAIDAAGPDSSPIERLEAALRAHLQYVVKERFSSSLTAIRQLPRTLRDAHMSREREYARIFADLLQEAEAKGYIKPGYNLLAVRMLNMGALTWVAQWFDPKGPMTLDELGDQLIKLLREGLIAK